MTNPQNAFFFEIEEIPENSPIFEELQKEELFFSYFQVDQKYYLFFYGQKPLDINLIELHLQIIEELDRKQRKIRSLRGFFFYALEIMKNGKDFEILRTNLQVSFWRKLKTILRQNKKEVLLQFLFGRVYSYQDSTPHSDIIEMIQNLQTQVNSLQQKIIELEKNQSLNSLSGTRMDEKTFFETPIGNYTLKSEHRPQSTNLLEDDSEVRDPTSRAKDMESKSFSVETDKFPPRSPFKPAERSEEYKISSNQEKAQNRTNFITLGKISEQERGEIIQTGFQLQAEGRISLKKYYESTDPNSLFQLKGYSIKYESIRRTKLYQSLKE